MIIAKPFFLLWIDQFQIVKLLDFDTIDAAIKFQDDMSSADRVIFKNYNSITKEKTEFKTEGWK
jgi:hypothetical protein